MLALVKLKNWFQIYRKIPIDHDIRSGDYWPDAFVIESVLMLVVIGCLLIAIIGMTSYALYCTGVPPILPIDADHLHFIKYSGWFTLAAALFNHAIYQLMNNQITTEQLILCQKIADYLRLPAPNNKMKKIDVAEYFYFAKQNKTAKQWLYKSK